jgi:hypothetical protein
MITEKQKALMQHTMSNNGRNWFHTDKGCDDANEFAELVEQGFATEEPAPGWMGGGVIYRLTADGQKAI